MRLRHSRGAGAPPASDDSEQAFPCGRGVRTTFSTASASCPQKARRAEGFCGLEVRAPSDFSDSPAGVTKGYPGFLASMNSA